MSRSPLSRMLADDHRRPDPLTAFKLARGWFIAGRRIEMQELAADLGVSRATLFRWVGRRDELLAEIIWSVTKPTLASAEQATSHLTGGTRIAELIGHFATSALESEFFGTFIHREPERALRILTTRAGSFQSRYVEYVETAITQEVSAERLRPPLPVHDLAYLIVRISETFIYSDLIVGEDPDPQKVNQAIGALLRD